MAFVFPASSSLNAKWSPRLTISAPLVSAAVRLAQAATLTLRGFPIMAKAWSFVAPLNEKPLFNIAGTQEAVPVTAAVRKLPDESNAKEPLPSLSFHWASRLPPKLAVQRTSLHRSVLKFEVNVDESATPSCTGIWARRPDAVLLLLMVLASVPPMSTTTKEFTPPTVARTVAPEAVVPPTLAT